MGKLKKFWNSLGPGLIAGAVDDDPAGIGIYTLAGAKLGLATLWTVIATLPFMIIIQRMCGRIGLVSGKGLAANMKKHYPAWILGILTFLIVGANIINIGADISAMSAALRLAIPLPTVILSILISLIVILSLVFLPYWRIAKYMKWIAIVLFAYIGAAFFVNQPWREILIRTIVPHIEYTRAYLGMIVAIFGTTISPYLFFWQAAEAVEQDNMIPAIKPQTASHSRAVIKNEIGTMYKDIYFGMAFSNLITFFIIILSASTLFQHGFTNVQSVSEMATVLRPLAGPYANLLFLIGIIASGILAIPVLAGSAAYALAEMFGWREGFDRDFGRAKQFYIVIILATILGLVIPELGLKPVDLLYYTGIIFGCISPFLIAIVIHMANNRAIMGPYTSRWWSNVIAFGLLIIMTVCAVAAFVT